MKSRTEMLEYLHNIQIGAQPTEATMDMGLQYEYVTNEGWGENLGSMGDWPVYVLHGISDDLLNTVKNKINSGTLSKSDFSGTALSRFYDIVFRVDRPSKPSRCDFFEGLLNIRSLADNTLYVLCDVLQWKLEAWFFENYDELANEFIEQYSYGVQSWEELDDNELAFWIKKIKKELSGISLNEIGNND